MQETVESSAGHNRITGKDVGPFCKGLVGSDDCSRSRALEQIGATTALAQLDQLAQRAGRTVELHGYTFRGSFVDLFRI